MKLYTQRHEMRKPIEHTSTITIEMYALLLKCCEKYYKYLTYLFPLKCHHDFTDRDYLVFDNNHFFNRLNIKIPTLFRDQNGNIGLPQQNEKYDQYALLDLIEFVAKNIKDIREGWNHNQYKNFWNIDCLDTTFTRAICQKEINEIFDESGLLYTLNPNMEVERVVENGVLSSEIVSSISTIQEQGIRELLEEAIGYFRQPKPEVRKIAVEKIWDAFERLKTYYTSLKKNQSADKIVDDMSNQSAEYKQIFEAEFKALTDIGNNFRIRHHETNKIDITDLRHYDYFFNRCLALISTAISYLGVRNCEISNFDYDSF